MLVTNEGNNEVFGNDLHRCHTDGFHDPRTIRSSLKEHDIKSDLANIGSFSQLSSNQHVPSAQSSSTSPISVWPTRRAPSPSPERLRRGRDGLPKGITALHSYNRSPPKPRSSLRQTVIIEDLNDKSDENIDTIEEDTIIHEATHDTKKSFIDSLGSLRDCFVSSSQDKIDTATKNCNASPSLTRVGKSSRRTEDLSPKHNRDQSTDRVDPDDRENNRGRLLRKTLPLTDGSLNSERGRSRNARNEHLKTSRSNYSPSRWRSLSCYSADTLDISDTAEDLDTPIAHAHKRSCSASRSPLLPCSPTREISSSRRHKHYHRHHYHRPTRNTPQTTIISSSVLPLQHDSNCRNRDTMGIVGFDGKERQSHYIHYHLHYVMSRRRSVSNHT